MVQSMFCNLNDAIDVVQLTWCKFKVVQSVSRSLGGAQSMCCNLRGTMSVVQYTWCNICDAIYVAQSVWCAIHVVQLMWC
eukprot:8752171-Pyramimonas_sp.AAC.1